MIRHALSIVLILLAGCPASEEQAADVFAEAQFYHDDGDLDKAIAAYSLAIDLDPRNPQVYLHRADARLVNGDPDGALADCDEAIRLGPDRVNAYRGRAAVHVFRGGLALAIADSGWQGRDV